MNWYLENSLIENIFNLIIKYINVDSTYANILRENITDNVEGNIELCTYDELGLINIEESLDQIKDHYLNSFCEDSHEDLLIFVSDFIHDLGSKKGFNNLYEKMDEQFIDNNIKIEIKNTHVFLGEIIDTINDEFVTLNVLKMQKSFQDINRIEMISERVKDSIFLYKNHRYTACLALISFALEGFLRGIFTDKYEEFEEQFKIINGRLGKTNDGEKLYLDYLEKIKPSIAMTACTLDFSKRIDVNIRKVREKSSNSTLELKIDTRYAGLLCSTEKESKKINKNYTFEKLIEKAQKDNLIDEKVFEFQSFNFLRTVRNNIVHSDKDNKEITHAQKTKKILFKIIEFINTSLYYM